MIAKPKKKRNYVDNKRFLAEIVEYKRLSKEAAEAGLEKPRLSEYIGECILLIATNYAHKPRFKNYSFKDQLISDAIENCLLYFDNFDPAKSSNPFAYFTQCTHYAFFRGIYREEKSRYAKYKTFQERVINTGEDALMIDSDNKHMVTTTMYDNLNDFIQSFEEREAKKKEKRKVAKQKKQGLDKFYEEDDNEG